VAKILGIYSKEEIEYKKLKKHQKRVHKKLDVSRKKENKAAQIHTE
jgi:hypothetical protein